MKRALGLLKRRHRSHTFATGAAVSLEHRRKTRLRDPLLQVVVAADYLGFRNPNAFTRGQPHEGRSRKHQLEAFWRSQRALNQRANRRFFFLAALVDLVEV